MNAKKPEKPKDPVKSKKKSEKQKTAQTKANPQQIFESSVQFSSILIYFEVRLGPGPLRCPSLTRLPVWVLESRVLIEN